MRGSVSTVSPGRLNWTKVGLKVVGSLAGIAVEFPRLNWTKVGLKDELDDLAARSEGGLNWTKVGLKAYGGA